MNGGEPGPPQLMLLTPLLMTLPMIVPQPVSVALGEMTRPSAKTCVPPRNSITAALVPSPMTKGRPFDTMVPLVKSVPPLKLIAPVWLVSTSASAAMLPASSVNDPPGMLRMAVWSAFETRSEPPVMTTWPVENVALPTVKFTEAMVVPPARRTVPEAVLVSSVAT